MKTPKTTEAMVEEMAQVYREKIKLEAFYKTDIGHALDLTKTRDLVSEALTQLANQIHTQSALEAEGRKTIIEDLMNKIDTLVGYLEVPELPEQTVRLGIIEEWEDYKREAK